MTAVNWKNNAGGNWNTGSNWSTGSVPGSTDDVTVNTASAQTITYSSGSDTILSLYFGTQDTLALSGGKLGVLGETSFYGNLTQSGGSFSLGASSVINGTITQTAGTLSIATGTLSISGTTDSFAGALTGATVDFAAGADTIAAGATISLGQIELTGASLTLAENLNQAGSWLQTGGTLALGSNTLTLAGTTALEGGIVTGSGKVLLSGQTQIANGFAAEGQISLVNTGTISQTGYFYLGYNGPDTATLTNQAGAVFEIDNDSYLSASVGATLTNAGTLLKAGSGGLSQILANTVSTGTVTVASGDLRFQSGSDSFGGTINGSGLVEFTGGQDTLASGLSLGVGTLLLDGAAVSLGGALSYGGIFEQNSGTLSLGGHTLTLSGPAALDGGETAGSGTIAVSGTTDLTSYFLTGSTVVKNTGTLIQTGSWYVGYFGSDTAQFINAAGATWQLDGTTQIYGQTGDQITNAGAMVKATGSGAATIADSITDTGSIAINAGSIRFSGSTSSFSGAISGTGLLDLDGPVTTLGKGVNLTVASVLQETGLLTIGTKLNYGGNWSQSGGTLSLGNQSLTLSGNVSFDGGSASGSGKISVKSADLGNYALTGTVGLTNTGSATVTSSFYDGYYAGDMATLTNGAKSTLSIVGNNAIYGSVGSTFVNAGKLIKANGGGTSVVAVATTSTGTVTASTGTLRFSGGTNSFAGAITGSGTVELNAGATTLAKGLAVSVSQLLVDGAAVTLGGSLTLTHGFSLTGGTLALGGNILTVTGGSFDGGEVVGAGTIALSGATDFEQAIFTGSETITNAGTVDVSNTLYIGYNSSDTVQLKNLAGGTIRLDAGNSLYGDVGSSISNAGSFIKDGAATSAIVDSFSTTGTVAIAAGTLRLSGGTNSLGGVLNGPGTLELNTGNVGFAAGVSLKTGAVLLDGASATIGNALSYAGAWTQNAGTVTLSGITLGLSGNDAWTGGVIAGSGTLAISGTEAISNAALEGSATLSNTGTIIDTAYFYVGYNSGDTAVLQNAAGGTIMIENTSIGGNSASLITNAGNIVKTGASATQISPAVTNIGSITLAQGGMAFLGAVSGAGTITADTGTSLTFQAAVASGGAVVLGADTVLGVNATSGFGDTIHGFAQGDLIDLNTLGYGSSNTLTYSGAKDTITVSNGSSSVTLALAGSYSQNSFQLINDHGVIGITHT